MKRIPFIIGFFVSVFFLKAQHAYEKGTIIDSIPVSSSENENFALYLPHSFDRSGSKPIVFIFDPAGRGSEGIRPFVAAAETYGHILVCSNAIKNGPYDRNFALAERWFADVLSRFAIDRKQMYVAGFSGGSRLASAIATLTDQMAGVIACGAGLSQITTHLPTNQQFSYVGLCGYGDMNFKEMFDVRGYLDQIGIDNTLITYEGNHRWPSQEQLLKAFDWLAIQGLKKGTLNLSNDVLNNMHQRSLEEAAQNRSTNHFLGVAETYNRMIQTYEKHFAIDSISNKLSLLKKSKPYKRAKKEREAAFRKEEKLTSLFTERFNQDYEHPKTATLSWWKKELKKLEDNHVASNAEMGYMYDRIRFKVFAMAHERIRHAIPKPNEKQIGFAKAVSESVYQQQQ